MSLLSTRLCLAAVATAALTCSVAADANAQVIVTERPVYTWGTTIVPQGSFQLEVGVASNKDFNITLPQAFVRYGIIDILEVRASLPSVTLVDGDSAWGMMSVGPKVAGMVGGFGLAGVASLNIVTDAPEGADRFGASLSGVISRQLNQRFSVAASANYDIAPGGDGLFTASVIGGMLIDDPLALYLEGVFPIDDPAYAIVNLALAYIFQDKNQVDAWIGVQPRDFDTISFGLGYGRLF